MSGRAFGRRPNPQNQRTRIPADTPPAFQRKIAAFDDESNNPIQAPAAEPPPPSVDEELAAWKRSRKFTIPWRQLSLMASLCFGIASFELPASVNSNVQLLLYALMAMSLYAGISKRLKKLFE